MSQQVAVTDSHPLSNPTHVLVRKDEWDRLVSRVEEVHKLITAIEREVAPAIESLRKGGIMSLLRGF